MSSGVNGTTGLPALRPYQLGAFALSEVYLLFALCVMCVAVTKLLKIWRHDPRLRFYYGAKHHLRRNIVTYILELIVTTAIFFVYCIVGLPLLMVDPLTPMVPYADSIEVVVFFGLWLVALYLWELAARLRINWQLALHHTVSLFLVCACGYHLALTGTWCNVFGMIILVMTAVTEQPAFVALLLYRMELYRHARNCFYVAGCSSIVIKTACIVALIPMWIRCVYDLRNVRDVEFWLYGLWPLVTVLYVSQMYGAVILFKLARSSHRRFLKLPGSVDVPIAELRRESSLSKERSMGNTFGGLKGHLHGAEAQEVESEFSATSVPLDREEKQVDAQLRE